MAQTDLDELYAHPDLYRALRKPEPEVFDAFLSVAKKSLGRELTSAMDPACGPGDWLRALADRCVRVAGNDLSPQMAAEAARLCNGAGTEFTQGDMCHLTFQTGPFDLVFEVAGTCGVLDPSLAFPSFLRGLIEQTQVGGVLLLSLFFVEPIAVYPYLAYESPPLPLDDGSLMIGRYEVLGPVSGSEHKGSLCERMRRTVIVTEGPRKGLKMVDEYQLFAWTLPLWKDVIKQFPQLTWLGTAAITAKNSDAWLNEGELVGEVTVALKRES